MAPSTPHLPKLPRRSADSHKGDCGRVLLIAGSHGMAGAAALAAEGALRSGAGYVEIVCPSLLVPALTQAVPSALLHPQGEMDCLRLGPGFLGKIMECAARADAVVVGPGIGPPLADFPWIPNLLTLLQEKEFDLPLVVDADAINHLSATAAGLALCGSSILLTPHPGEAARLLAWPNAAAIQADRMAAMEQMMDRCSATILLKGAGTLIGLHGRAIASNTSGNVGMATAGCGDVLSGHLGTLLTMGLSPYDAARLGAYLHGRAGDLFVDTWGPDGLTAADLPLWISKAMQEWRSQTC